tara:strand:- start:448 stop:828 length:381 start_codon:yes stop_codon:yes gene_type:complete
MNKLEMQIQSVDVRYDDSAKIMYYNLSCSLLNIYKGRCNLFLINTDANLKQELLIKHNRAIMEGNLIAKDPFFDKFHTFFSMKFDKPGRIELHIDENLKINNQGILEIKDEIITVIKNYKIFLPLL